MKDSSYELALVWQRSVLPTFAGDGARNSERLGSCVLLKIDGRHFVSTAAHVVNQLGESRLWLGRNESATLLGIPANSFYCTSGASAHLDVGFHAVRGRDVARFSELTFFDELAIDLAHVPTVGSEDYVIFGYPSSKSQLRTNHARKRLRQTSFRVATSAAALHKYTSLNVNPSEHLILNYHSDGVHIDGERANPPKLQGVSGGAVFHVAQDNAFSLVGIPLEHPKTQRVVISSRIEAVVAFIRYVVREHPDLGR